MASSTGILLFLPVRANPSLFMNPGLFVLDVGLVMPTPRGLKRAVK